MVVQVGKGISEWMKSPQSITRAPQDIEGIGCSASLPSLFIFTSCRIICRRAALSEVGFIDGGWSTWFMLKEHHQIPFPMVQHDKKLTKKGCMIFCKLLCGPQVTSPLWIRTLSSLDGRRVKVVDKCSSGPRAGWLGRSLREMSPAVAEVDVHQTRVGSALAAKPSCGGRAVGFSLSHICEYTWSECVLQLLWTR